MRSLPPACLFSTLDSHAVLAWVGDGDAAIVLDLDVIRTEDIGVRLFCIIRCLDGELQLVLELVEQISAWAEASHISLQVVEEVGTETIQMLDGIQTYAG